MRLSVAQRPNKTMKIKYTLLGALCGLSTIGTAVAADSTPPAVDPEADRLLRAACAQLASAKVFTFKAEVWTDAVVGEQKITTTKTVEAQVRRPDRVHMETRSPQRSRGFWYDGKTLTLLDRPNNFYGTVAVPETIDKVLDVANDQYGINFPLEDLLVNDPYGSASRAIQSGIYFGKISILGTPCQHIAFSTERVDWQLWIQDGADPLPRKLVITCKLEEGAPQYTAIFSDWKFSGSLPDKAFVFRPRKGAAKIEILPAKADE